MFSYTTLSVDQGSMDSVVQNWVTHFATYDVTSTDEDLFFFEVPNNAVVRDVAQDILSSLGIRMESQFGRGLDIVTTQSRADFLNDHITPFIKEFVATRVNDAENISTLLTRSLSGHVISSGSTFELK